MRIIIIIIAMALATGYSGFSQNNDSYRVLKDSDIVVTNLFELENIANNEGAIVNLYYMMKPYPCDLTGNEVDENINDSIINLITKDYGFSIIEVWVTGQTPNKYGVDYSMACIENIKKHFEKRKITVSWNSCNMLIEECYISQKLKLKGKYNFVLKLRREG